ncbi:MAG: hypothetical protein SPG61_05920 [Arcanobacterium sp.]|nr:hypothetical protein [Arcanobacterium sp.]
MVSGGAPSAPKKQNKPNFSTSTTKENKDIIKTKATKQFHETKTLGRITVAKTLTSQLLAELETTLALKRKALQAFEKQLTAHQTTLTELQQTFSAVIETGIKPNEIIKAFNIETQLAKKLISTRKQKQNQEKPESNEALNTEENYQPY